MKDNRNSQIERPSIGYMIALAAAIVPFALRQILIKEFNFALPPFLLFSPAILLVALGFGFWTGILTTLVAGVLADYWILPPAGHWRPQDITDVIALGVFLFLGIFMSFVAERYRSNLRRMALLENESERRESEARFQSVLRDSRDVIFRYNAQAGWYEFISPSILSMLGYTDEEMMALKQEEILAKVHPDDRAGLLAELTRIRQGGRAEVEYRMQTKDGQYRWLSNAVSYRMDEKGNPLYREGSIRDITEKKNAQEAFLRSATQASTDRTTAAIAHEINNPLTAVTNLLYLAASHPDLPVSVRDHLKRADAELQRIAKMTRRALSFYREAHVLEAVSINDVLKSAIELLQHRIEAGHIKLFREVEEGLRVMAISNELRQIVSNLIANSLEAVSEEGAIRLRAHRGRNARDGRACVRIAVADNGKGIPVKLRPQVFEPYFTTKGTVGTGLGLWISSQLVEKYGGSIHMRSSSAAERHGTVFVVELPAAPGSGTAGS